MSNVEISCYSKVSIGRKKSLKMDLAVIIIIQLSALFYGIYSIFEGRPAWLAYNVDRFELVRNNEIVDDNNSKSYATVSAAIDAQTAICGSPIFQKY